MKARIKSFVRRHNVALSWALVGLDSVLILGAAAIGPAIGPHAYGWLLFVSLIGTIASGIAIARTAPTEVHNG